MSSNFKSDFFAVAKSNDEFDIVLNPPASDESIQELSNALGFSLPPTLIELLRLADGEADGSGGMFCGESLLSCEGILLAHDWHEAELDGMADDEGHFVECPFVKQGLVWRPTWIPIVFGHNQTSLFIDSDPSEIGVVGQVVLSAQIDGTSGLVASSIPDLFHIARTISKSELLLGYPLKKAT